MCGIVGVVQGEQTWEPVDLAEIKRAIEAAHSVMPSDVDDAGSVRALSAVAGHVETAVDGLRGVRGVLSLAHGPQHIAQFERLLDEIWRDTQALEDSLDRGGFVAVEIERLNAALVRVKDAVWKVRRDALRIASIAIDLAGRDASPHTVALFGQIEIALSAIDRLEVRGRDSAGIAVFVRDHRLDLSAPSIKALVSERASDVLLRSSSVRSQSGNLCFVYKAAAEVGELGDNTRAIRDTIRDDPLLHLALEADSARALVLGHTRWASVGMISEPNAHPLASEGDARSASNVFAVLNGDIDNHVDITEAEDLEVPAEITTDAKIIPLLVSRRLHEGHSLDEAFRTTVASFEGSVAIAAVNLERPDRLLLALRGSGQALYVGLSAEGFLVASEPYGFVEQADRYIRMEGEDQDSRGQVVVLDTPSAQGDLGAIRRLTYDGTEVPVTDANVRVAEITTRDVDRGPFPHFLLKELNEAPRSFRQTLRGRLIGDADDVRVVIGPETLPDALRAKLGDGTIRRIVVIGQGTAQIAGRALGATLAAALNPAPITVEAVAATELSGFGIRDDMSDTLVIAISQSGTTADTNRTVDVVRARGAHVVAIVNRRQSDLTDRADGVLHTSDGRDVEMAVPSTKAFYAQVAAGFLLAAAISSEVDGAPGVDPSALHALRDVPAAMEDVLSRRAEIAEVVQRHVPFRRDWAVVGNGANRIAAEELRIKLSELCYKSISSDVTEDKKHIDLSAEPLILVCAAGLRGSNAEDVAKEIVYFRAHKAAPIVIAGEGEGRYEAALDVLRVPSLHPDVAFILSAMAGHVFGYEAALAIDALATPLRQARSAIELATEVPASQTDDPLRLLERVRPGLAPLASRFHDWLRAGTYDGHLDPSTAVRVASLLRYATGTMPLDVFQVEYGKIGTPTHVLADLMDALTVGIDKLTRPVDAIRHQAKTVTVGISRAEETLLNVRLVREMLGAGVARDRITYGTLRELAALDPAIERVAGYTLYRVEGDPEQEATVRITDRGGIARDIPSRTERDPRLRGTKHRVAIEREVLVTRGHDGRILLMVPEVKGAEVTGILLLHIRLHDRLPADVMRSVLQGYRGRYSALRDTVTEFEPTFRDDLLGEIPVTDLLLDSILALGERWRQPA